MHPIMLLVLSYLWKMMMESGTHVLTCTGCEPQYSHWKYAGNMVNIHRLYLLYFWWEYFRNILYIYYIFSVFTIFPVYFQHISSNYIVAHIQCLCICEFISDIWGWIMIMGLDGHYWMVLNESQKSVPESWYWSQRNLDSEWFQRIQNMFLASKLINEQPWIIPKIFLTLTCVCHWTTLNMPKPCV